jgi:hypothetical protein
MGLDGVSVSPLKSGVDIEDRLHVVVPWREFGNGLQRISPGTGPEDCTLPRA